MIKNPELVRKFKDSLSIDTGILPYAAAFEIFESMWQEAVTLGVFPPKNPMEGIETDIRVAKVINSCLKKSSQD